MKVKIKRVDKSLPLPVYHSQGAVGCDLYARLTIVVPAKTAIKIPANVIIQTPPGYMFMIASRGSTPFKKGLLPPHGIGVGDQDFWGPEDEYQIPVYNFTDQEVTVEKGERIAQGMFVPIERAEWEEVEDVGENSRGMFGSTGTKHDQKR